MRDSHDKGHLPSNCAQCKEHSIGSKKRKERENSEFGLLGGQCGLAITVCVQSRHAEDGLEYMSRLRNPDVFRFCAIPQVMAIATLAEIYNNHKVFTGPSLLSAAFFHYHTSLCRHKHNRR